jgi:hypothetical protein
VEVAGYLLPAGVIFNDQRFEPALKQVSATFVPSIEPDAITDVEPLHGAAQVGFGRFDQLMKMIVHQHVGMDPDDEPFGCLG